ncbi:hypothetical protein [Nocardioides salsibiostraticola]
MALAVACGAALLAMIVTDWPLEVLAEFWAGHSVLAGVLSTVLMLGIGFLIFEVWDLAEQSELDGSLTAAGMGGLVDHVVDVEVALALVAAGRSPDEFGWQGWEGGRPLKWLTLARPMLRRGASGSPAAGDPRGWKSTLSDCQHDDMSWRLQLIDQSVRRLITGIKAWTPVVGRSRNGTRALISLAQIRNELMGVDGLLGSGEVSQAGERIEELRARCRVLVLALEGTSLLQDQITPNWALSGARPEVLAVPHRHAGQARHHGRPHNEWSRRIEQIDRDLNGQ